MTELTEIQKFYSEKTVFITGGTGFVGKCLVEKLLRSCFVKSIIILIRIIGQKSFEQRTEEYFKDVLFSKVKRNNPTKLNAVMFVNGNIALDNFGLSPEDYKMVIERTNVVVHAAATIKLNSPLHVCVPLNVIATKTMITMVQEMKNIQAFLYVSTIFAFCNMDKIDETVPTPLYTPEFLMELIKEMKQNDLDEITPTLVRALPNSYLLTKQAAECLISRESEQIPVSIYRPAAIGTIYREPLPGWTNNYFGAIGVGIAIAMGATKILNVPKHIRIEFIPVDIVVNCMIAVAWNTAVHREKGLKIYNHHIKDNTVTLNKYLDAFINNGYPLEGALRYPGYTNVESSWIYKLWAPFIHFIPNIILDLIFRILRKNANCMITCHKVNRTMDVCKYFIDKEFTLEANNIPDLWNKLSTDDQEILNFDPRNICWDEYVKTCARGIKEFLFKEDMSKLDSVKFKHDLLYYYECFLIILYTIPIILILYLINHQFNN